MCLLLSNIFVEYNSFQPPFETYFGESGSVIPHSGKYGIFFKPISKRRILSDNGDNRNSEQLLPSISAFGFVSFQLLFSSALQIRILNEGALTSRWNIFKAITIYLDTVTVLMTEVQFI